MSYAESVKQLDLTQPNAEVVSRDTKAPYKHIAEMHFDEVTNLWTLWASAVRQPHYDKASLTEIEKRLHSHIAGMRLQEEVTWTIAQGVLNIADAGEMFAAAQLAFRSYDLNKIRLVVSSVTFESIGLLGLVHALAWLPDDISAPWFDKFFTSRSLLHKYLATEAARVKGIDFTSHLDLLLARPDCFEEPLLLASLAKSVGVFKHHGQLASLLEHGKNNPSFWLVYGAYLLGSRDQLESLQAVVFDPYADGFELEAAIQIAFRVLPIGISQSWISALVAKSELVFTAVRSVAVLGDPQAIPWLIGLMFKPAFARLAGHAFQTITGCNLEQHGLSFEEAPYSMDEILQSELNADYDVTFEQMLPWPDGNKIWSYWQSGLSDQFQINQRYLLGREITTEFCEEILYHGHQFERECAAYELALQQRDVWLANVNGIQCPEP